MTTTGTTTALSVEFVGNRFLRKMVRLLVATLVREACRKSAAARVGSAERRGASSGVDDDDAKCDAALAATAERGNDRDDMALLDIAEGRGDKRPAMPAWQEGLALVAVGYGNGGEADSEEEDA